MVDKYFPAGTGGQGTARAFDADQALDAAMMLSGGTGTRGRRWPRSTAAMGINVPSLYAAFGNKEALFKKALDWYGRKYSHVYRDALAAPTAREVAERISAGAIQQVTRPGTPGGCLTVQGGVSFGPTTDQIGSRTLPVPGSSRSRWRQRFERCGPKATCRPGPTRPGWPGS